MATKTSTGDHADPANRLVIVEDKHVLELSGQVATLTAEVEKMKTQKEKQRKEAKKLKSVLDGVKCGADVQRVMNDNYDLKKQVGSLFTNIICGLGTLISCFRAITFLRCILSKF